MMKWDIYIADVPFEDLPETKLRPVVVLEDSVILIDCLKMTSQAPRPGEYVLKMWKEAGLKKPTTVRISKRLLLKPDAIRKHVGSLHPIDILEISKASFLYKLLVSPDSYAATCWRHFYFRVRIIGHSLWYYDPALVNRVSPGLLSQF